MTSIACTCGRSGRREGFGRRGVTLIELLVAVVIGAIACLGLSAPMMAERRFWILGNAQAESQRNAQLATRAIARVVREAGQLRSTSKFGWGDIYRFETPECAGDMVFIARVYSTHELQFQEQCGPQPWPLVTLIGGDVDGDTQMDRNESWLTEFTIDRVGAGGSSKTLSVRVRVQHGGVEEELLETTLFLRNWNPDEA